jgi:hypothetical protein
MGGKVSKGNNTCFQDYEKEHLERIMMLPRDKL